MFIWELKHALVLGGDLLRREVLHNNAKGREVVERIYRHLEAKAAGDSSSSVWPGLVHVFSLSRSGSDRIEVFAWSVIAPVILHRPWHSISHLLILSLINACAKNQSSVISSKFRSYSMPTWHKLMSLFTYSVYTGYWTGMIPLMKYRSSTSFFTNLYIFLP